jgi:hypothetical protein
MSVLVNVSEIINYYEYLSEVLISAGRFCVRGNAWNVTIGNLFLSFYKNAF